MASTRRGYVPVDTTTIPTRRRRLSSFNTCIHSGLDKWKSILRRPLTHKVHFRRHSSFYSNPPTPTTPSPENNTIYRRSYSPAVPLKPILKSSAAYRYSLQASRTAPSISTVRRSASHEIRVVPPSATSRYSIAVPRHSFSTSRRSFSVRRASLSTSRRSISVSRPSTSCRSMSPSLNSLDLALTDTHSVAVELLTMATVRGAAQSGQGVQNCLTNFKKHLKHLSHSLSILDKAEAEQADACARQVGLQQKYMDAVDRQIGVMNELALGVGQEVDGVLSMRSGSGGDGRDEYPSPAKSDDTSSDIESFLGHKIAFDPEDQRMGREIDVMDVSLRHTSIRNELEVLAAQMALETLDRGKLFKVFQKMSRKLKDEIDLVAEDRDGVQKLVRRHGGRSERKDMEEAVGRFKTISEGFVERSGRIGEAWLVMGGRDFFKH